MLKPIYNRWSEPAWKWYLNRAIRKSFDKFEYDRSQQIDDDKPLLVIANHFSYWDVPWIFKLCHELFRKRFYCMTWEEQLQRYPVLRSIGAFSVNKGTRGVIESLDFATSLLEDPKNMVLIFPQGEIKSIHAPEITFQKGVFRIIERFEKPLQILISVALVDYASRPKPMVRFYFRDYTPTGNLRTDLKRTFLDHYNHARKVQTENLYKPFRKI